MKTVKVNGIEVTMTDEDAQMMLQQAREVVDQLGDLDEEDEDELTSFEDCWKKVNENKDVGYFIESANTITDISPLNYSGFEDDNILPRKELARKVQLYTQLLIVAEALNDGELDGRADQWVVYRNDEGYLNTVEILEDTYMDIVFKDEATAEKAIDIAVDIFHPFFDIK